MTRARRPVSVATSAGNEPAASSRVVAQARPARPFSATAYLAALNPPRIVLWCYLLWWSLVVVRHFDPSPSLWLSSLGLSAIIGSALFLSTAYGGATRTTLDRWQIARLYMMPFCVSSFSALIKDRGFVLVFHPSLAANLTGLALCAAFLGLVFVTKRARHRPSGLSERAPPENDAHGRIH